MVRIVNGEIVRDDNVPVRRTGQGPATLNRPPSQPTASHSSTSAPAPVPAGQAVDVKIDALAGVEQQMGLVGQHFDLPPVPALGWARPTQIRTVILASVVAAALVSTFLGMSPGRTVIIALLVLAGYIHVLQTGGVPQAHGGRR